MKKGDAYRAAASDELCIFYSVDSEGCSEAIATHAPALPVCEAHYDGLMASMRLKEL